MEPLIIIFTNFGLGGVQRKIVDIVNYLSFYQPKLPIYIILRRQGNFNLISEIKNSKVKVINYDSWQKIHVPFFFPVFITYKIWQLNPQAVLAFLDTSYLGAVLSRIVLFWRKFRLVVSEDHYTSKIVDSYELAPLHNFFIQRFYPMADAIFTCSQATKDDLIKNYRITEAKIKIIKNWTTLVNIKNQISKIKNDEKNYDLIYIGRFAKTKNLGFLIRALRDLKKAKGDVRLCLIGEGEEENRLKKMVKEYNLEKNVKFLGVRLNIVDYLVQAKILVYCSQYMAEGFPLAILEAMASKLPVLSYRFAGVEEFLNDGQDCYLYKNKEEFIAKALVLINKFEDRKKIVDHAYLYVVRNHSPQNMVSYIKELGLMKNHDKN